MRVALLVVMALLTAAAASAEVTARQYKEMQRAHEEAGKTGKPSPMDYFLFGVGAGIEWSNTEIEMTFNKRMFCQPEDLALNLSVYKKMLAGEMKFWDERKKQAKAEGDEKTADMIEKSLYVAPLLLRGFQRAYPCK